MDGTAIVFSFTGPMRIKQLKSIQITGNTMRFLITPGPGEYDDFKVKTCGI